MARWRLRCGCRNLAIAYLDDTSSVYQPPADANVIFIIQPIYDISNTEFDQLNAWVKNGGTLILAGDQPYISSALSRYDFSLSYLNSTPDSLPAETPLLTSPDLTSPAPVKAEPLSGFHQIRFCHAVGF